MAPIRFRRRRNDMEVHTQSGSNSTTYYNSDFAIHSDYDSRAADRRRLPDAESGNTNSSSCRSTAAGISTLKVIYGIQFYAVPTPATDAGPGASATGTLTVTDTTLTGTLTIISTTDEPTGATTTFQVGTGGSPTVRTSLSAGDGFDGFNVRTADGSPFGNAWYGVTTSATLTVNLTGTFTDTAWTIDGGAVTFSDPGFACQQGGLGSNATTTLPTLCNPATYGGGFQANGGMLSWGMDIDGAGTGSLVATPIEIRDASGTTLLATMSGVLAHLALDGGGTISTTDGEFRYAFGTSSPCPDHLRWGARPAPETTRFHLWHAERGHAGDHRHGDRGRGGHHARPIYVRRPDRRAVVHADHLRAGDHHRDHCGGEHLGDRWCSIRSVARRPM